MAKKIIMLVCAAGMSTSLLVSKMKKAAEGSGKDYEIFAKSTADIDEQLASQNKPDIILLGPQVSYMKGDVKKKTDAAGVPMSVISMQDYGLMNGEKVLAAAEKIMNEA